MSELIIVALLYFISTILCKDKFVRMFQTSNYGTSIFPTSDGGYIMSGTSSGNKLLLIKVDNSENGEVEWAKSYSTLDSGEVIQDSDGNYVICGDYINDGAIMKLDGNGAHLWSRSFGGSNLDFGNSISEAIGGGYFVTGMIGTNTRGDDLLIAKFDTAGNDDWSFQVGGAETEIGYSVKTKTDGGFIVAGASSSFSGSPTKYDVFVTAFSSSGSVDWSIVTGNTETEYARDMVLTADDDPVIAGITYNYGPGSGQSNALIAKISPTGVDPFAQLDWGSAWGTSDVQTGEEDSADGIGLASDGGFLVTGKFYFQSNMHEDLFVRKFDSLGAVEWTKIIDVEGDHNDDKGNDIIELNGDISVVGTSSLNINWVTLDKHGLNCTDNYNAPSGGFSPPRFQATSLSSDAILDPVWFATPISSPTITDVDLNTQYYCYENGECFEKSTENLDVCTSQGSCIYRDKCVCNPYYDIAEDCSVTTCYNVWSNSTSVCNGIYADSSQPCWPLDQCNCALNYYGDHCNVTTCSGVWSNSSLVCDAPLYSSGNDGACFPKDVCHCYDNYFGVGLCDVTTCGGIYSNDSSVCSGMAAGPEYGCWPYNECNCTDERFGEFCEIVLCDTFSNYSYVCSSEGRCISPGQCLCNETFFGDYCGEQILTPGVYEDESTIVIGYIALWSDLGLPGPSSGLLDCSIYVQTSLQGTAECEFVGNNDTSLYFRIGDVPYTVGEYSSLDIIPRSGAEIATITITSYTPEGGFGCRAAASLFLLVVSLILIS